MQRRNDTSIGLAAAWANHRIVPFFDTAQLAREMETIWPSVTILNLDRISTGRRERLLAAEVRCDDRSVSKQAGEAARKVMEIVVSDTLRRGPAAYDLALWRVPVPAGPYKPMLVIRFGSPPRWRRLGIGDPKWEAAHYAAFDNGERITEPIPRGDVMVYRSVPRAYLFFGIPTIRFEMGDIVRAVAIAHFTPLTSVTQRLR